MDNKALQRVEILRQKNGNPHWVNKDLYRLLFRPDLYIAGYERIKSKPGNMTEGIDGTTIDGTSLEMIDGIIKTMRDESFQFKPAKRVMIPKPKGGKRPLGIPTARDKIVQECIRIILEAIYDSPYGATFHPCSHGFRRSFGVHTAIADIDRWNGTVWFIEGDIKKCFDTIDHSILIEILQQRIQDDRFIRLIRKSLRAGYLSFTGFTHSLVGTPQGSIISPILANVYLHEFDKFVSDICHRESKGEKRKPNKEYQRICWKIAYLRGKQRTDRQLSKENSDKLRKLSQVQRSMPSQDTHDPDFCRVRYVRYADDWIIGVTGDKLLAEWIRREVEHFLRNRLKLELSVQKTHITHSSSKYAQFLGTLIGTSSSSEQRVNSFAIKGTETRRRVRRGGIQFRAPVHELVKKLADKGFCHRDGFPCSKKAWVFLDDADIISQFSAVNRGLLMFYSFVDNFSQLGRIQYILQYSCAMTLAHKHRSSVRKIMCKYGYNQRKTLSVTVEKRNGESRDILFWKLPSLRRLPRSVTLRGTRVIGDPHTLALTSILKVSKSKLFADCCLCGSPDVEMHHVRHIRKMGETNNVTGFTKLMALVNRKQVPVCRDCHVKIHRGDYDSVSLSKLASQVP
jgi:group II intron reverse transcriptase/maturase